MPHGDCPRETELLGALQAGTWPACCGEDLCAHVQACPSCSGLMDVARPLIEDRASQVRLAPVPSSAAMWWKLQRRARHDAAERAMRPILAVQAISLACAAGLLVALAGLFAPEASRVAAWLGGLGDSAAAAGAAAFPSTMSYLVSPQGIAVGLAGALLLIVTPIAIYLAAGDR